MPEPVDQIFHNATIYTVNKEVAKAEAMAIQHDSIVAVGDNKTILNAYKADKTTDLEGKPVYPGFIDAHCHFYWYGQWLQQVDLNRCRSFDDVLDSLQKDAKELPKGEWLRGRGWDQNKWPSREFPRKNRLDTLFPERPVFLMRIDGHAALANQVALKKAGIGTNTTVEGGAVEQDNGELTGILLDNAIDLVQEQIPDPDSAERYQALMQAQENCLAVGLTTISDASLEHSWVETIEQEHEAGNLKMRIYGMLNASQQNLDAYIKKGVHRSKKLHLGAIKLFADGALGSRGACLLAPYHDKQQEKGFLLHDTAHFHKWAQIASENGYQLNTHAIGDSACRTMLNVYTQHLQKNNDKRWRIEHCQIVNPHDLDIFGKYQIIPSVQPSHATSDMKWASDRLGEERVKTAYAYQDLLLQNNMIALGSDFPIEEINPLLQFYTAVARKNKKGEPPEGFQTENALTRKQALKGLTRWAAYANREEDLKGSLEAGKLADFVVMDKDIMTIEKDKILDANVLRTYISGEKVFEKGQ